MADYAPRTRARISVRVHTTAAALETYANMCAVHQGSKRFRSVRRAVHVVVSVKFLTRVITITRISTTISSNNNNNRIVRISVGYRAEFRDREYQTRPEREKLTVLYGVLAWQLNRKK